MEAHLTILGTGSALPTFQNSPSGQILELCDKQFLIDCGEGIQLTMRQMNLKTSRLYSVFISHLHGDHCFGLLGLLTTFDMMGRTQPLHVYAHPDLEKLLRPQMDYHLKEMKYEVVFHAINPRRKAVIFSDRTVTVETIPLKHKVPTCGFLFYEHHRRFNEETREFYYETRKRYAYCSDTQYKESIVPQIEGVDTLFHESTYIEQDAFRCKKTMHSTARQAASIALKAHAGQLIIGHYSSRVGNHSLFLQEAQEVFPDTILGVEREMYVLP
ncbi:MAG: ribonuclease Z [Paludibacteraceae bacterium]|nr:ribonuclease Z [Paludibacteraceae bacterium]